CSFNRMLGLPVNIYRGGSDESTAGPYVTVRGCVFTDCCNKERGSVLRLIGPQKLLVSGCRFVESGRGGASVRLDETTWEDVRVTGCTWTDSGRVISNRNVTE
ncbi:MAG: poly(beta-D-mannuronate) lyase, partial [Muribaculaceae bacterium]|nr:poly(beta-D-mannuronate) lyase [Muribaculaceae bacterium]